MSVQTCGVAEFSRSGMLRLTHKWYIGTLILYLEPHEWMMASAARPLKRSAQLIERIQTGVRLEKRLLKVLKAVAELKDMSLGDLIEGMALHAFEGKCAFEPATVQQIAELKKV